MESCTCACVNYAVRDYAEINLTTTLNSGLNFSTPLTQRSNSLAPEGLSCQNSPLPWHGKQSDARGLPGGRVGGGGGAG